MPAWFMTGDCEFRATGQRFDVDGAGYVLAVRNNGEDGAEWIWTAECSAGQLSVNGKAASILKAMRAAEEKLFAWLAVVLSAGRRQVRQTRGPRSFATNPFALKRQIA
jgi:hypothetical protein